MKNKNRFITILFVLIIFCVSAFALTACKDKVNDDNGGNSTNPPSSDLTDTLELTRTAVQLVYGESAVVVAKYKDKEGVALEWKSSDESVATVDDGVISSTGLGTATITAIYGDLKAECSVSVTYGDYQPILTIDHLGDELILLKGDIYDLVSRVTFNGKSYSCDLTAEIEDNTVASFEKGKLTALKQGETEVTVKGNWNNFDTPLMKKTFTLKVTENDIAMYMSVEIDGEEEVSDEITLSVTDSFEGVNYANKAIVKFVVKENGSEKSGELTLTSGEDVIELAGNTVTAKGLGEAVITAEYTSDDNITYTKTLTVKVDCPVVIYSEHVEWTDDTLRNNVLDYFAEGAVILAAKQGSKNLEHSKAILTGVVFNGYNTEPIEILTSKGGYIFENIYGCNELLTEENFLSVLTLGSGVKNKYYALAGDIGSAASPIDMKNQQNATKESNFAGVFDGRGYTVYADTYENGIFGGYGYDAVIKNAKFVITFKSPTACGITSDKGRWMQDPKMRATIENVYIETTNFGENNHVISNFKVELLKMKDVLVEVNGVDVADFDGRDNVGVLFESDISYYDFMMGNAGLECFDNVRVVVDKFLPMANGKIWNESKFITFALNDEKEFGNIERVSDNRESVHYCVVTSVEKHSEWLKDVMYATDQHIKCVIFCYGSKKLEEGGVYRYNTMEDLKKAGVTQVGDWRID